MMRIIDADKLNEMIRADNCSLCRGGGQCGYCETRTVLNMIVSLPTIQLWAGFGKNSPEEKDKYYACQRVENVYESFAETSKREIDFLDWLSLSVVLGDDFKKNPEFYRELICRKLVELGKLEKKNDYYILSDPEKWLKKFDVNIYE